jgi:hypothetical protein
MGMCESEGEGIRPFTGFPYFLGRFDKVELADATYEISAVPKPLIIGGVAQREIGFVVQGTDPAGLKPCRQPYPGGSAQRGVGKAIFKPDAPLHNPVEVRRVDKTASVAAEEIRPVLICHDKKEIRPAIIVFQENHLHWEHTKNI